MIRMGYIISRRVTFFFSRVVSRTIFIYVIQAIRGYITRNKKAVAGARNPGSRTTLATSVVLAKSLGEPPNNFLIPFRNSRLPNA